MKITKDQLLERIVEIIRRKHHDLIPDMKERRVGVAMRDMIARAFEACTIEVNQIIWWAMGDDNENN
jgi:hypothetical protein